MVQAPRPLYERNSFEYAVALFERLQAKVLLIGGAHPLSNLDGSSDLVRYSNRQSIFSLLNQVVLREWGEEFGLGIQSRVFTRRDDGSLPPVDVLLAFDKGVTSTRGLSELGKHFFNSLIADNMSVQFVRGEAITAGYEIGSLPQALYLSATQNKEFVILWLSPTASKYYHQQSENNLQGLQFTALDIPTVTEKNELYEYILTHPTGNAKNIPDAFRDRVKKYTKTQDILILQDLRILWPQYRLERFIDINFKQAFLLVYTPDEKLSLIANLFPRDSDSHYRLSPAATDGRMTLIRFIETRTAWLELF